MAHQVVRKSLFLHKCHSDITEFSNIRYLFWPVLCTFGLVVLLQIGQHYDDLQMLFPYHSPKVIHSTIHRTLCTNELFAFLIAQHKIRVNIIRSNGSVALRQPNTCLIVGLDVWITVLELVFLGVRMFCGSIVESIGQYFVFAQESIVGVFVPINVGLGKFGFIDWTHIGWFGCSDKVTVIVRASCTAKSTAQRITKTYSFVSLNWVFTVSMPEIERYEEY